MSDMHDSTELLSLTADIVSSHVSNNSVAVSDLLGLISNVYAALSGLGHSSEPEKVQQEPAVSIRSSIKPDYIVCLEDGKKLKMLKRHLMTSYGLTPDASHQMEPARRLPDGRAELPRAPPQPRNPHRARHQAQQRAGSRASGTGKAAR